MAEFEIGDPVWIDDGYSGSPHAAVVDNVADDGRLYATSAQRIMGDSRYVEWTISADKIKDMVSPR